MQSNNDGSGSNNSSFKLYLQIYRRYTEKNWVREVSI